MGKYKYIVGIEDDAQSGRVLCCKPQDRKAAAIPGEVADIEQTKPVKRHPRSRVVRAASLPKRFAPEKLTTAESISGT